MTSKSLRVFGVVLPLASDDLFLPGAMGAAWKLVLVCGLAICLGFDSPLSGDDCRVPGVAFLSTALGYSAVQLGLYLALVHASMQGSILRWRERNTRTRRLLPAIALSYLGQLGLASFGVFASSTAEAGNCDFPPVVLAATIVQWLDVGQFVLLLAALHWFFQPRAPPPTSGLKQMETKLRGAFTWLTCLTCGVLGTVTSSSKDRGEASWMQLSVVVHSFLHTMMREVLLTDVLAAVLLLRVEQRHANHLRALELAPLLLSLPHSARPSVAIKAQSTVNAVPVMAQWSGAHQHPENSVEVKLEAVHHLEQFASYLPYMRGIYGWKIWLYTNPWQFLWHAPKLVFTKCCRARGRGRCWARGGGGAAVEDEVFKTVTGLKDHHVVYSSFSSELGEAIPYTISLDHDREAIVISLRGTLSFADLVTDLMATPAPLQALGEVWGFDGNGHYAHSGMLQVALQIRQDLATRGLLPKLFAQHVGDYVDNDAASVIEMFDTHASPVPERRNLRSRSQYAFVVLGHSLGGGVGAILTLLLRGEFPHCQCLAYDPPGCIFSSELAEASQAFCKTIVCGVDMVPRLSWHSAKRFRAQLLDVLLRSKTSKAKILSSLLVRYEPADLLFAKGTSRELDEDGRRFAEAIERLNQEPPLPLLDEVQMYIPGRVLHLAKTATVGRTGCGKRKIYAPSWVPERADLANVQVSKYMLLNHFPDFIEWAVRTNLRELARELKHEARTNVDGVTSLASHNPKLQV